MVRVLTTKKPLELPVTVRTLDQIGNSKISKDKKRKALMPGKRISKNEKIYWETRKNRSDKKGKKV